MLFMLNGRESRLQQVGDQGNWLWCSKDDYVIDAIKKVSNWLESSRRL